MTKFLFSFLLIAPLVKTAHAQAYGGFKGGLNICSFTGRGVVNGASPLASGNIGFFENVTLSHTLAIQPEPTVSWEGETYDQPRSYNAGSFKFHYINIPVLLHIKFPDDIYGETGPQAGFLLSARQINVKEGPGAPPLITRTDYRPYLKKINYGWDFGVGYTLSKMLSLGVRYNLGLSNLGQSSTHREFYRTSVCSFNAYFSPSFKRG
jgi:hypothetical protein